MFSSIRTQFLVLTAALFIFSGTVSAATLTVCGNSQCDHQDIQPAVNSASNGDTVVVADDRVYEENLELFVPGLTLTSAPGKSPIIDGGEGKAVHITVDGVEVSDFDIGTEGLVQDRTIFPDTAIHVDIDNSTDNVVLADNSIDIEEGEDPAILVGRADNIVIRNNTVTGDPGLGINLDDMNDAVVDNNEIDIMERGMLIVEMQGVEIRENTVRSADGAGLDISGSSSIVVEDNPVIDADTDVISLTDSSGKVADNEISGGTGIDSEGSMVDVQNNVIETDDRAGIEGDTFGTIAGNFIDSTGTGISVNSEASGITSNDITAGGTGISTFGDVPEISDNRVRTSGSTGISIFGTTSYVTGNKVRTDGEDASAIELNGQKGTEVRHNDVETMGRESYGVFFEDSSSVTLRENSLDTRNSHPVWFKSRDSGSLAQDIDRSNTANGETVIFLEDASGEVIEDVQDAAMIIAANSEDLTVRDTELGFDGVYLWNSRDVSLTDNRIDVAFSHAISLDNAASVDADNNWLDSRNESILVRDTDRREADFQKVKSPAGESHFSVSLKGGGITYTETAGEPSIVNSFSSGSGTFRRDGVSAASKERVKYTDRFDGTIDYVVTGLRPDGLYVVRVNDLTVGQYRTDSNGELEFDVNGGGENRIEVVGAGLISTNISEETEDLNRTLKDLNASEEAEELRESDPDSPEKPPTPGTDDIPGPGQNIARGLERFVMHYRNRSELEQDVETLVESTNQTTQQDYIVGLQLKVRKQRKNISRLQHRVDLLEERIRELNGTVPERKGLEETGEKEKGGSGSGGVGGMISRLVGSLF